VTNATVDAEKTNVSVQGLSDLKIIGCLGWDAVTRADTNMSSSSGA